MGVIRKQGVSSSLLIYLGFALGALNILVLFAKFLSLEQAGLIFLFVAVGKIILGFASFGNTSIMNKFFPYYSGYLEKKDDDFLMSSMLLPIVGILLSSIVWLLADDLIIRKTISKSPLFADYYYWMIPYSSFLILYTALETYSYTRYRAVFPTMLRELGIRVLTSLLVFLLIFKILDFSGLIAAYSFIYLLLTISMIIYLGRTGNLVFVPKISKVTRRLKGKMMAFGSYIYGGLIIAALAENADTFIIGSLIGLEQVAIYQTGHYIATIIMVPYRGLSTITAPVISQAWKDRDLRLINDIYQKSSVNQMFAALLIFGSIWINIDFLLEFLGANYSGAKPVIFVLGIARVLDMSFGHNVEVLHNSKYWKVNFISYVVLVLVFLPTNYYLVMSLGIIGSAISGLVSFFLFNLVRFIFLWYKCNLQPFSMKNIWILLLCVISYFCVWILDVRPDDNGILWAIVKGGFFASIFTGSLLAFKVSQELNDFLLSIYQRIKGLFAA